ncbi:MAG: radical SAM protein [Candidatus Krumholzibacteriota bacterium]|nr:radical SAM protein [Candidatus Krumholzibacteriota bacterium]
MHLPVDAVVAVTYRCDSRCNMCNLWKIDPGPEMIARDLQKLPSTLKDINITGGEPFLLDDIVEIVRTLYDHCGKPRIVISTSGFQKRKIVHAAPSLMKIGRRVGIAVSLDGIGETHDKIRGVEGGFQMVVDTLGQLKKMGYKNVRVAFTVQRENVKHLGAVYDLSRQLGFQFTTSVAQNSEFYFFTADNQQVEPGELENEMKYVMRKELLSLSPKRWLRAYFYAGVLRYNKLGQRALKCTAGRESFFIDPAGIIYPCLTLEKQMGNLNEHDFGRIWKSGISEKIRDSVDGCGISCWMICTARASMKKNPLKPLSWIFRNYIRLLAGRGISVD